MPTRITEPLDIIGERLRDEWCDLLSSPLPDRLRRLLEKLELAEKAEANEPKRHKRQHERRLN